MTSRSKPRSGTTPAAPPLKSEAEPAPGTRPEAPPAAEAALANDGPQAGRSAPANDEPCSSAAAPESERASARERASEGDEVPGQAPSAEAPRRRRRKRRKVESGEGDAAGANGGSEAVAASDTGGARPGGAFGELRELYLRIDRRVLGLFRIYFGFVLLVDVLRRVPDATFFYSSSGAVPNYYSLFVPVIKPYFSLYVAFSTTAEVRVAFFATAFVYLVYLVGYRTRLMQILVFVLYTSLNTRNSFVENGGTMVLALVACWSMFLPLGDRFSVDALLRSLRARREHTPEALNDRAAFRAPAVPHYSLVVLAITLQIAAIYFFNKVNKVGATWRQGESVHWVLWQNRIATHLAAWLRMHEPWWLSPVLTKATLVIEGLATLLVLSPIAQRHLRTLHFVLACSLHAGIALLMTLGPFSYVMIGFNLLLLPSDVFDWAAAKWAGRKPLYLVAYDPSDPALHQLARLLARLDALGRLRFVSAEAAPGGPPKGGAFFARAESGGAWSVNADALVACLKALPLGSLSRLGPTRSLAARFFARRDGLASSLSLCAGHPASAPGPAAELAPSPSPARARLGALGAGLREALVGVLLLASLIQMSRDNAWVPARLRLTQPAVLDALLRYPRLLQGWRMFAPDAPKDDGTIIVDAVTVDGRHIDPLNGGAPDFEAPLHGPWFQSQLWCDYYLIIRDNDGGYRDELKKYLLNWHTLEKRPPNDRITSFEVWWVSNDSPPPGNTVPFNINKRLIFSGSS